MDEQFHQYKSGALAITGNSIVAVGIQEHLSKEYEPKQIVDCGEKILMPGLINAHTHVPMTLLRGLADDLRLDVWLMGYMMPVEREYVSPDFVQLGTKLPAAEMIQSGVTTFNDMYYFEEDIARATANVGMRAVCGQSVMKFPTPDAKFFEESLAMAREYIKNWKNHDLIVPAVAPHAPYTCTPEILQACAALAIEFGRPPAYSYLRDRARSRKYAPRSRNAGGSICEKSKEFFDAKVIAAHCVHIDEGEIHTLNHYNAVSLTILPLI